MRTLCARSSAAAALLLAVACVAMVADVTVATIPVMGDVCFTSRAIRTTPTGNPNTHPLLTTDEAAEAFHATRIDWIYTVDAAFMENATANGLPVTAAINANVPDTIDGPATYDLGRIRDLYGNKLTAPWMRAWGVQPYYGCVNNATYANIVFSRSETLIERGSISLQHDDPHSNAEAVSWKNGGCYCDACMAKFGPFAHARGLANTTSFNYREYLLSHGGYGTGSEALREAFIEFQTDSVVQHVKDLRAYLDDSPIVNRALNGSKVVLSCNNGGHVWDSITTLFDYGMGELAHELCTPDWLRTLLLSAPVGALPKGKAQVVTMPKISREPGTPDKLLTRASIALTTALGGHMLVPWDIYLPTPNAERYYGNVSDYQDVYALIRAQGKDVFAGFPDIVHTWAEASLVAFSEAAASPSTELDVTDEPAADVYWLLRSTSMSDLKQGCVAAPGSALTVLIHAVDWMWPRQTAPSYEAVQWPLPSNAAQNFSVAFDLASLCGVSPDELSQFPSPASVNVSVVDVAGLVPIAASVGRAASTKPPLVEWFTGGEMIPWAAYVVSLQF